MAAGTITLLPNSISRAFDLPQVPSPANSLVIAVNGIVQEDWTLVYVTVQLAVVPNTGDLITAVYQIDTTG
jgi:hypothetical protein